MECFQHPDRTATAYCRTCGRALCGEDQREIYGVVYCQECLARNLGQLPAQTPGAAYAPGVPVIEANAPNPGMALLLGFIPGVGAIYNGQYLKAFMQVVIFGFLIAMTNNSRSMPEVFGIGIAAFYFYMLVDSYRTAKAMASGQPIHDVFGSTQLPVDAPVAAIILIAIGGVFLLRSLGLFDYDFSRFLWPGLLIAVGVYLLSRRNGTGGGGAR